MPFLIDGHNVIAALDDIDLEDPHDEAKLVIRLRTWTSRTSRKAIVVFDGGLPGGPSRTLSTADVKVIFAARHHTNADRVIHERVSALPDAGNWTVVSSDREVRDQARETGAKTLTAQEFVELLERPTSPEKDKPDTISAAEVAAWLEIFTEPEEEAAPAPQQVSTTSHPTPPKAKGKPRHAPTRPPESAPARHGQTIGERLGMKMDPAPPPPRPTGKPTDVDDAEVAAWLEVFHDDPDSRIPPPNLPEKRPSAPKTEKPAEPVVRKDGSLSDSEVDTWLSLFEARAAAESQEPEAEDTAAQANQQPTSKDRTGAMGSQPTTPPKTERRKRSPTLAKHQEKRAAGEGKEKDGTSLSQDDLELWHRLFDGEG